MPDHELAMVLIGVIKGNGSGVIKPVTRLICGVWKPASSEVSTHYCHDHDHDHDQDHDHDHDHD